MRKRIRLTESDLRGLVMESVISILRESESRITPYHHGVKKDFIRKIVQGYYDDKLYDNKELVKNIVRQHVDERLWDKVFCVINQRYNYLRKRNPDGIPALSDDEKEERSTLLLIHKRRFFGFA